jgi:hypothetical protein
MPAIAAIGALPGLGASSSALTHSRLPPGSPHEDLARWLQDERKDERGGNAVVLDDLDLPSPQVDPPRWRQVDLVPIRQDHLALQVGLWVRHRRQAAPPEPHDEARHTHTVIVARGVPQLTRHAGTANESGGADLEYVAYVGAMLAFSRKTLSGS